MVKGLQFRVVEPKELEIFTMSEHWTSPSRWGGGYGGIMGLPI